MPDGEGVEKLWLVTLSAICSVVCFAEISYDGKASKVSIRRMDILMNGYLEERLLGFLYFFF